MMETNGLQRAQVQATGCSPCVMGAMLCAQPVSRCMLEAVACRAGCGQVLAVLCTGACSALQDMLHQDRASPGKGAVQGGL